jgi:hypothetical protein
MIGQDEPEVSGPVTTPPVTGTPATSSSRSGGGATTRRLPPRSAAHLPAPIDDETNRAVTERSDAAAVVQRQTDNDVFGVPRPSLRGAILWQRERSAWALTLSSVAANITLLGLALALLVTPVYPPVLRFAFEYWAWGTAAVLLLHLLAGDLVRIRPQGVTAVRIAFAWSVEEPIPLGGTFQQTPTQVTGDADRPHEPDPWQDELMTLIYYENRDEVLGIDCLRPKATVDWLNAQLRRIQSLQLPKAQVVEGTRGGEEG